MRKTLEDWLNAQWYGSKRPALVLILLAWVYRALIELRRLLWRLGLFRAQRVGCPIIVVGNLAVGGSGKTPLVIWLVRWLSRQGVRVGVVSRGYGRQGNELASVAADSDPLQCGDEPVLIARETGAPVMVGRSRAAAARALLQQGNLDLLVCDDGLQHWALHRDIEIVVEDMRGGQNNGRLIPAGPLRTPEHWLDSGALRLLRGGQRNGWHAAEESLGKVYALDGDEVRSLAEFTAADIDALAGIARPERFFSALEEHGLRLRHRIAPGDHGRLDGSELRSDGSCSLLMTAKDAVKYRGQGLRNSWWVELELEPGPEFIAELKACLRPVLNASGLAP